MVRYSKIPNMYICMHVNNLYAFNKKHTLTIIYQSILIGIYYLWIGKHLADFSGGTFIFEIIWLIFQA